MFAIANFSRFIMVRAYVERHRYAGDNIWHSRLALLTFAPFTLAEGLWICTSASAAFLADQAWRGQSPHIRLPSSYGRKLSVRRLTVSCWSPSVAPKEPAVFWLR